MEILLVGLIAAGVYLYHESTVVGTGGSGGVPAGGINIAINAAPGSQKQPPQPPKPGGGSGFGVGGGGGGMGGLGGGRASGTSWNAANDPIANVLDDRQSESYANRDLINQLNEEATNLTPYEKDQLAQLEQQASNDYWNAGNVGPAPLADVGGSGDDLPFQDDLPDDSNSNWWDNEYE